MIICIAIMTQIGVAVGRVKTIEGLCVKNFRPSQCKPHPKVVELYYTGCSVGNIDHINKNCCKVRVQSSEYSESDSENSDMLFQSRIMDYNVIPCDL
jgi:hypothetical protein